MVQADLDALEANQEDQSLAQIEQAAKQAAIEQQEVDATYMIEARMAYRLAMVNHANGHRGHRRPILQIGHMFQAASKSKLNVFGLPHQ